MKKSDEILAKIIPLTIVKTLPSTFMEVADLVWKGFNLGREYESQLRKEIGE